MLTYMALQYLWVGQDLRLRMLRSLLVVPIVHNHRVRTTSLCSFAIVVFQQSAEPFVTLDRFVALSRLAEHRKEHHIALALMRTFLMKMDDVLFESMAQRTFPKQNQPREGFLFYRAHPPLRIGIQIR